MKSKTTIPPKDRDPVKTIDWQTNRVVITEMTGQELEEIISRAFNRGIEYGMKLAEQKEWVDQEEAMEILGVGKNALYKYRVMADSPLIGRKKGRGWEYLIKSLDDFKNWKNGQG